MGRGVPEMTKFAIPTPLGICVRTSEWYWQKLIIKHPDIAALEAKVIETLTQPDEIRQSNCDPNIILFYLTLRTKRWVVVVVRRLNGDGFVITAYQTDAIKEGDTIWRK